MNKVIAKGALLSKVCPPVVVKRKRSVAEATLKDMGLTIKRFCLRLLHKKAHDNKRLAELLIEYDRANLYVRQAPFSKRVP